MERTIVILAKSFKHGNYCIAGREIHTGAWIRPVSDRMDLEGAVLNENIICEDGHEAEILDIVTINFISKSPTEAQNENLLYDKRCKWRYTGTVGLDEVIGKFGIDKDNFIFTDNQRFLESDGLNGHSLMMTEIFNPRIKVTSFPNKNKPTICFTYHNNSYSFLSIGDIELYNTYVSYPEGFYSLGESRIAVFSLTNSYDDGRYYKMLAQLF